MAAKKQAALLASCRSLPNSPSHSGGSTPVSGVFPGQVRQSWTLCYVIFPVWLLLCYCCNEFCFFCWLSLHSFIHFLLLRFLLNRPVTVVRAVITPHHFPLHLWSVTERLAGQQNGKNKKVQHQVQFAVPHGDVPPDLRYISLRLLFGAKIILLMHCFIF